MEEDRKARSPGPGKSRGDERVQALEFALKWLSGSSSSRHVQRSTWWLLDKKAFASSILFATLLFIVVAGEDGRKSGSHWARQ